MNEGHKSLSFTWRSIKAIWRNAIRVVDVKLSRYKYCIGAVAEIDSTWVNNQKR